MRRAYKLRAYPTRPQEGRALLAGSPSDKVVPAATMLDAARKAVELANANTKAGA